MPDTNTLPQQIIENSRAFTETLSMENIVFQNQLNGAIGMTINAFRELIVLCRDAVAVGKAGNSAQGHQNLADAAQQALSDIQKATGEATSTKKITDSIPETPATDLNASVVHAVSISYMNAVNAQQQAYITQQAAATQVISTILSVATATLAVAVKEAEGVGQ